MPAAVESEVIVGSADDDGAGCGSAVVADLCGWICGTVVVVAAAVAVAVVVVESVAVRGETVGLMGFPIAAAADAAEVVAAMDAAVILRGETLGLMGLCSEY